MNRKDFLKRFGISIGAVAIAPKVLAEVINKPVKVKPIEELKIRHTEWKTIKIRTDVSNIIYPNGIPVGRGGATHCMVQSPNGTFVVTDIEGDTATLSLLSVWMGQQTHHKFTVIGSALSEGSAP